MTREQFKQFKQDIAQSMRDTLERSKEANTPLRPYCVDHSIESIHIKESVDEAELRHLLKKVHTLSQRPNTTMTMKGDTRPSGRYDYFSMITYSFDTIIVKAEIADIQIEDKMRKLVKGHLKLRAWQTLECKVMQLFKDGSIEWAQVVEAHKGECTL